VHKPLLTPLPTVTRYTKRSLYGLALSALVINGVTVALAAPSAKKALQQVTCKGEFGSGSGVAGSSIGGDCFIFADTDQERIVQDACAQNSICEARAMATVDPDGAKHLETIISVKQTSPAAR
jgi:hypothetical protein